jgi:tRNA pseudouridine55 synthase
LKDTLRQLSAADFLEGQMLLINKPLTWTSFDAVKKIRFIILKKFGLKKIKVGHAGTLDPLATGLLVICTGKFTKKIAELTLTDKMYTGTFLLGSTTPSYDLETAVENEKPTGHITPAMVESVVNGMRGTHLQMPPQFSAKQVDGKRAYDSARQGKTVVLEPKEIHISHFEADTSHLPEVRFKITCSKGTYIRSIAHDLGEMLGCGAHLTSLIRKAVGAYQLEDAISPEVFQEVMTA